MMIEKLSDFLIELSNNPAEVQAFVADPDTFLYRSGLDEQDKKLIKRGDMDAIQKRIQADETIPPVTSSSAASIVLPEPIREPPKPPPSGLAVAIVRPIPTPRPPPI
jgi:hypothetical protein